MNTIAYFCGIIIKETLDLIPTLGVVLQLF